MNILEWLSQPWPWYLTGPLLGLMVPILLFSSNKQFGVSSSFQHICAAVLPRKPKYFQYDWKSKSWSIVMMAGVVVGALLAVLFLGGDSMPKISDKAVRMFSDWGLRDFSRLQPPEIFAGTGVFSPSGLLFLVLGGFLVGFGTRYANGCTSGHAIMGISLTNLGSLAATVGFFAGGTIVSNFVVPLVARLVGV